MSDLSSLRTTQTLFLPIFNYAVMIENQFGDFIVEPKSGIYKAGDIEPCIISGKSYFSQVINKVTGEYERKQVLDINKETNAITDENGDLVIPSYMMKQKEHYLSNAPSVPSRGLFIIELLIKKHIESISPWSRHSSFNNKFFSHLKNNASDLLNEGHLDKLCESLFLQVNDFIGNDTWHIYFVKFSGVDILIEKSIDYRVYVYHQKTESGEW